MKVRLLRFSAFLAGALFAACTSDSQRVESGGDTGGSGGSGGGTSVGGDTGLAGSSTGGTTSSSTSSSTIGGGGGGPCDEAGDGACGPGEYCDYPDDLCGTTGGEGTCTPRPSDCPSTHDPVCACDGTVYENACAAEAAGVDVRSLAGCPSPPGEFPCGSTYCEKDSEYCLAQPSGDPTVPDAYSCEPLPVNCLAEGSTCECLADVACGIHCQLAAGGFTLTCDKQSP